MSVYSKEMSENKLFKMVDDHILDNNVAHDENGVKVQSGLVIGDVVVYPEGTVLDIRTWALPFGHTFIVVHRNPHSGDVRRAECPGPLQGCLTHKQIYTGDGTYPVVVRRLKWDNILALVKPYCRYGNTPNSHQLEMSYKSQLLKLCNLYDDNQQITYPITNLMWHSYIKEYFDGSRTLKPTEKEQSDFLSIWEELDTVMNPRQSKGLKHRQQTWVDKQKVTFTAKINVISSGEMICSEFNAFICQYALWRTLKEYVSTDTKAGHAFRKTHKFEHTPKGYKKKQICLSLIFAIVPFDKSAYPHDFIYGLPDEYWFAIKYKIKDYETKEAFEIAQRSIHK